MENILLTLVVVLLVLLVFMMGGLFILGWKLLKNKTQSTNYSAQSDTPPEVPADAIDERLHPEIKKRMEEAKRLKAQMHIEATCFHHPKEPSEGACAICDRYYCKACLKSHQNLLFCREHVAIFLNSQWNEIHSVKSTPQNPEAGVEVVEWKKGIWETEGTPMFIQTHYKINVDGDQIESWVVLFARDNEKDEMKKRLGILRHPTALDQ